MNILRLPDGRTVSIDGSGGLSRDDMKQIAAGFCEMLSCKRITARLVFEADAFGYWHSDCPHYEDEDAALEELIESAQRCETYLKLRIQEEEQERRAFLAEVGAG